MLLQMPKHSKVSILLNTGWPITEGVILPLGQNLQQCSNQNLVLALIGQKKHQFVINKKSFFLIILFPDFMGLKKINANLSNYTKIELGLTTIIL